MAVLQYEAGTAFPGVMGRTIDQSEAAWPAPRRAKEGAPNVLYIVLDDVGFGQLGCYGSPIKTPNIDGLAKGGLRYNNMHTTAICSPSRSCMLTGRNHHSNGMACIIESATGFPGSNCHIPFENGFLSEMLLQHGYNTYAVGKWHLSPGDQVSAAGPYDRWPLGRGFERFYGFLSGDTHQYYPELVYDNHRVDPPKSPEEGYHLTEDLVDKAITFIADAKQVAPNKPFFMYFCTGAAHAPHHAPPGWADRYKGQFDEGWDVYREKVFARQKELGIIPADAELSRHDPDVTPWVECSEEEKRLYARMMEVFAAFLQHTDAHTGRLLAFLQQIKQFDNTLIMLISDNGASAEGGPFGLVNENQFFNNLPVTVEDNLKILADLAQPSESENLPAQEKLLGLDKLGGPDTFNHYPWGWAWAGNTPFRRWKRETYRGGVSDPFIVHWPAGIEAKGEVRTQYTHAIDMVPTVLEALELEPPRTIRGVTQSPLEGVSLAESFADAEAVSKHRTQYFEMMGHRAIYHDGWRAVCPWPGPSFAEADMGFGQPIWAETLTKLDATFWELYHVDEDFAENHNVAYKNHDKLLEMIATWYVEAGKYNVLPVDGRGFARTEDGTEKRTSYTYYPGTQPVPGAAAVHVLNRSHTITADVHIPAEGAEGMIISQGTHEAGYAFFIKGCDIYWVHNYVGSVYYYVRSHNKSGLPEGSYSLKFEFEAVKPAPADIESGRGASGVGRLYIGDKPVGDESVDYQQVGEANVEKTTPVVFGISSGLRVGIAPGSPVCPDYDPPFEFTGTINSVTIEVSGDDLDIDPKAQLRMIMGRQ
ncbi:MAG: arylsulfatase [Ardenticatenaceae bacterium]